MKILFIISIAFFLLACILDYRSSLGGIEANPLLRAKDGKISKPKFFIYVGAALAFAAIAYFFADSLIIGTIIMVIGGAAHLWAMVHNKKVKWNESKR